MSLILIVWNGNTLSLHMDRCNQKIIPGSARTGLRRSRGEEEVYERQEWGAYERWSVDVCKWEDSVFHDVWITRATTRMYLVVSDVEYACVVLHLSDLSSTCWNDSLNLSLSKNYNCSLATQVITCISLLKVTYMLDCHISTGVPKKIYYAVVVILGQCRKGHMRLKGNTTLYSQLQLRERERVMV